VVAHISIVPAAALHRRAVVVPLTSGLSMTVLSFQLSAPPASDPSFYSPTATSRYESQAEWTLSPTVTASSPLPLFQW
jgi:hypothetical protein